MRNNFVLEISFIFQMPIDGSRSSYFCEDVSRTNFQEKSNERNQGGKADSVAPESLVNM
jgi:hypothetical protein